MLSFLPFLFAMFRGAATSPSVLRNTFVQAEEDACTCLNWQSTFDQDLAMCDQSGCDDLKKRDDNGCFNDQSVGDWCYVKNECDKLNGGQQAQGVKVSWKGCEKSDGESLLETSSGE